MPKRDRDLFHSLRAGGVRKKTAGTLAEAFSRVDKGPPGKAGRKAVSNLKAVVSELEDRAKGGPAKRQAAAKKAAATRKRKAKQRSQAARKAARTRARSK